MIKKKVVTASLTPGVNPEYTSMRTACSDGNHDADLRVNCVPN